VALPSSCAGAGRMGDRRRRCSDTWVAELTHVIVADATGGPATGVWSIGMVRAKPKAGGAGHRLPKSATRPPRLNGLAAGTTIRSSPADPFATLWE
jgi:hypothetical protein